MEVKPLAIEVNHADAAVALGRAKPSEVMIGEFAGVVTAVGTTADQAFVVDDESLHGPERIMPVGQSP